MDKDYYEILGVSRDASKDEIRNAHDAKTEKLHPINSETGNIAEFYEVCRAYLVIKCADDLMKDNATLPPENVRKALIGVALTNVFDFSSRSEAQNFAEIQMFPEITTADELNSYALTVAMEDTNIFARSVQAYHMVEAINLKPEILDASSIVSIIELAKQMQDNDMGYIELKKLLQSASSSVVANATFEAAGSDLLNNKLFMDVQHTAIQTSDNNSGHNALGNASHKHEGDLRKPLPYNLFSVPSLN